MTRISLQIYIEETNHSTAVKIYIIIYVIMYVVRFKYTTEYFLASPRIRCIDI